MGREVRMVRADWVHPTDGFYANGEVRYNPLYDGRDFADCLADWESEAAKWNAGEYPSYASEESKLLSYAEWAGDRPVASDYMPQWDDSERTHFMMYSTTSEGSPISPAFETPEQLARWLADTGASSFGDSTASYEAWLRVARGGYAPSAVIINGGEMQSGVEGLTP